MRDAAGWFLSLWHGGDASLRCFAGHTPALDTSVHQQRPPSVPCPGAVLQFWGFCNSKHLHLLSMRKCERLDKSAKTFEPSFSAVLTRSGPRSQTLCPQLEERYARL